MTGPDGMERPFGVTESAGMRRTRGVTGPDGMERPRGVTESAGMRRTCGVTEPDGVITCQGRSGRRLPRRDGVAERSRVQEGRGECGGRSGSRWIPQQDERRRAKGADHG
ncbi:hypothetical protein [Dactylosporangium sp. NPDC050588]|uniref:hypothetical protein n=1 Tax=Dactylosporangium sp. NPDC050588 TaxID=3157211 RepID=UPI0033C94A5E